MPKLSTSSLTFFSLSCAGVNQHRIFLQAMFSWLPSVKGAAIQVALDGEIYINMQGSHIASVDKAGVWIKSDSVNWFDDFSYAAASGK